MMRKLIPALASLALSSQPALASQTACVFSTDQSPHHYELEFIGYEDMEPVVVFSSTVFGSGKRFTLRPQDYALKTFDQKAKKVDLAFRNPNDPALPPSFGLVGSDGRAWFKSGSVTVEGDFRCGF